MRILHVSSARHYSGTERHLVDLCRSLHERGHQIFVALRPTSDWQHRLDFLPPENIFHVSIRHSFGVLSAMKIAEFVRDNDIDIIHAHVPRDYIPASIASHAAKPAKFVLTRHMLSPLKPFNKFALKNLSKAIGVSDFVGGELRSVFPAPKVVVIPNGLDLENLRDRNEMRNEFRKFHDIAPGAPLVGTLGELREAKGQRDFILAAAEVAKRVPECWFLVAGLDHTMDKSFRRELRRLAGVLGIGERVLWLDWLDDTAPFYAAIDVFVSPSHSESFGLAILEAMIRGTPVVATATEGARELLGDDKSMVPIEDPVRLGSAICDLLATTDRSAIGNAMRQRAAAKFSLERMLDETERVYEEICRKPE
ncbi:MAG TPA: glycosyltransferase family 4 protein [Pyrinomonadaceae bacterium]|nr:glycosyltransferase family 4 protein [Pyrinomonadaceae bacterium]